MYNTFLAVISFLCTRYIKVILIVAINNRCGPTQCFFYPTCRYQVPTPYMRMNTRLTWLDSIHIIFVCSSNFSIIFFIFLFFRLSFCLTIISVRCSVTWYSPFLYLWSVFWSLCLIARVIFDVCALQVYKINLLVINTCTIGTEFDWSHFRNLFRVISSASRFLVVFIAR